MTDVELMMTELHKLADEWAHSADCAGTGEYGDGIASAFGQASESLREALWRWEGPAAVYRPGHPVYRGAV